MKPSTSPHHAHEGVSPSELLASAIERATIPTSKLEFEQLLDKPTPKFDAAEFQRQKAEKLALEAKLTALPHRIEGDTLYLHFDRSLIDEKFYSQLRDLIEVVKPKQVSYPQCCGTAFCANAMKNNSFIKRQPDEFLWSIKRAVLRI